MKKCEGEKVRKANSWGLLCKNGIGGGAGDAHVPCSVGGVSWSTRKKGRKKEAFLKRIK